MKADNLKKKLISNARAIITNHITIPLGVLKMTVIMCWLRNSNIDLNIDLNIFNEYYEMIHEYPIGTERLRYNFEYLKKEDKELDKITADYKNEILLKCFEIVNKLVKEKL